MARATKTAALIAAMTLVWGLPACRPKTPQGSSSTSHAKPTALPTDEPVDTVTTFAKPVPPDRETREVKIVVHNATAADVSLDVTWTSLDFVAVAPHDARLGLLHMHTDDSICPCLCSDESHCPECEKPPYRYAELKPGESHETLWDGLLGRWMTEQDGDTCSELFSPPPGTYTVKVCDRDGAICGVIEADLSTQQTLRFDLGDEKPSPPTCPLEGDLAKRVATYHLVRMELYGILPPERTEACDLEEVTCVPFDQRDRHIDQLEDAPCSLLVIPGSDSLEAMAYLTPDGGDATGGQWSMFTDIDGTRISRVAYGVETTP